jgi:hypothetical protein
MTTADVPAPARDRIALRRAAVRATLAPSVHNTQPWRLRIGEGMLAVYADTERALSVLDPTLRQLTISCGCAVLNARAALAADGHGVRVARLPDPTDPTLLAVLTETRDPVDPELAGLDALAELRHTNRRAFTDEPVPTQVLESTTRAIEAEGAQAVVVTGERLRTMVAELSSEADRVENLDAAYRAELNAWTSYAPGRTDGVPAGADAAAPRSLSGPALVVVGTPGDEPTDWLRAGEALQRALLEITRHGFVASPLVQVTEVAWTRVELRRQLHLTGHPHLLLRVGRAPGTPATRRRRLAEVLREDTASADVRP